MPTLTTTPKYSAHLYADSFARAYLTTDTLTEIREELSEFAAVVGHRGEAWADVYHYDARDNTEESWGDYPVKRYSLSKRGAVCEELV